MDISIIISLFNEEESLSELVKWITKTFDNSEVLKNKEYEIVMINDGSTDSSWKIIEDLSKQYTQVKGVCFRRNYGKSAALQVGFQMALGDIVFTMDADLQDDPDELPGLYKMMTEEGYDIVSGWKKKRHDNTFAKNIPSKIYNFTARRVTKLKLHDMNCGLKAYRNEVVKNIEVYGDMHRYIPYIAKNAGFSKIGEKVILHHKRKYGTSKFGMDRFVNGFLDLLTISFLSKFAKRPMHIFGVWGILSFLSGFGIAIWIIAAKLIAQSQGLKYRAVTDQPLFYLALVALLIGVLLFLTGFIAELISRNSNTRNDYQISKTTF